jgi:hypothetical protein
MLLSCSSFTNPLRLRFRVSLTEGSIQGTELSTY